MIGASFSALSRQEGCTASHPPALGDLRFQIKDDVLQTLKKPPRVRSVHLRVMELKGQPERCFEKTSAVSALDDKGVVENAAVHTDGTVDLGIDYRRGAYDHAVGQVVICAALNRARLSENGTSQELTSPVLFFTMVFTAIVSYFRSSCPTGSR